MTTYNVYANACEFGLIEADTDQEARDKAAQMAGYESEAQMVETLGQPSEIVAEEVEDGIPVQYTNSGEAIANALFSSFKGEGNAEPTSRVLDGSEDQGYAEEWAEPGEVTINGEVRPASLIYLFSSDECGDDPDSYPWDESHAARILLRD